MMLITRDPDQHPGTGRPRGAVRPLTINSYPWQVYESVDNGEMSSHVSLMFVSDTVWRRLRNFPANWRDLNDAMLTDLGAHR